MRLCITITVIFLSVGLSFGQKQGNIWYFGEGAGLDFNSGAPVPIIGGNIFPYPQVVGEATIAEGSASICDSTGSLLFYSNGENIWNKNHQVMPNGDNLMGMYSSTHSSFIVPQPLSDSIFYVFTTDGLERNLEDGLRYSIVNMCLDNGLGDVVSGQKNIFLLDTVSEKLAGINHQNGKDIWLIAHKYNSDAFYVYLITENGIVDTVVSNIGSVHTGFGYYSAIGQMKASSDGNKIALVFSNTVPSVAEVFDFDKSTGILSNPISLTTENNEYGVEFSPDNSKLYITNISGLHQFDLLAGGGSQNAINASRTTISSAGCSPSGIQLGPDGKIYVSRCTNHIGVINNPNALGSSCNFVSNAIDFGTTSARVSFPCFIQGFEYHNGTYNCETTGVNQLSSSFNYKLYPNPGSHTVILEIDNINELYSLMIYDSQGRIIRKLTRLESHNQPIEVSNLSSGFYFIQVSSDSKILFTEKMIID